MRFYNFRCKACNASLVATTTEPTGNCESCGGGPIVRDYKAEGVGIGPAVGNIQRDFKAEQDRDLFLPSRKTFEKQHGHKGEKAVDAAVKEWNEKHEPHVKGGSKFRPK